MKKIILLTFSIFLFLISFSQDTIRIKHTNYSSVYSKSKNYPVLVEWWLTKDMVSCDQPLKRKDNFKPDPKLFKETDNSQYYVNSGFDRGHMMPAADNLCQTQNVEDECFYFSNMAPQYHALNAGDWEALETLSRDMARKTDSIKIWCGNVGEIKKIGKVSVPKYCWKVIYSKKENSWMFFLFENNISKPDGLKDNKVSQSVIENLTGFTFKKP